MTIHVLPVRADTGTNIHLKLVGSCGKRIVATASVHIVTTDSHVYAYLHDVLVKEEYRGRGYGRQLMMGVLVALQEYADDTCKSIKLQFTSSPTRVAANSLYQSLGFELVATATSGGTNLYQRIIESAM